MERCGNWGHCEGGSASAIPESAIPERVPLAGRSTCQCGDNEQSRLPKFHRARRKDEFASTNRRTELAGSAKRWRCTWRRSRGRAWLSNGPGPPRRLAKVHCPDALVYVARTGSNGSTTTQCRASTAAEQCTRRICRWKLSRTRATASLAEQRELSR